MTFLGAFQSAARRRYILRWRMLPKLLTSQMLLASLTKIPDSALTVPAASAVHAAPLHFQTSPLPPTTHRLLPSFPATACRALVVGMGWLLHSVPFHLRTSPAEPTAHTFLSSLPHTPSK